MMARCPSCDGPGAEAYREDVFDYRAGPETIEMHVRIPVFTCSACRESFVDHRGEAIRTRAVERMLKMRKTLEAMGRPDDPCPVCSAPLPPEFFAHDGTMERVPEGMALLIDHFIGQGADPVALAEAINSEARRLLIGQWVSR